MTSPVALLPLLLCTAAPAETLHVRTVPVLPPPGEVSPALGEPTFRFAAGAARAWLVRTPDTVGLYVTIDDTSGSAADEVVVSLDVAGDGAPTPQHDDFQWRLRRTLDSSVVQRGRAGRWAPPRDDPDWRLGAERGGGGWEVVAAETRRGWTVLLRLHPAWLAGEGGRRPALALRIYDGEPGGWYAWPPERPGAHPSTVEQAPTDWLPVDVGRP